MNLFIVILAILCCSSYCAAQKPVVLWHGMGDDCCNKDSIGRMKDLIHRHLPDTFVYSIKIGDTIEDDHKAGFFGNLNDQVDHVCDELSKVPELQNGFNAVGFSQGGLFIRAYVERCNKPKVHRLITFGSPHAGVSNIPNCMNPRDFSCRLMLSTVRNGVYTDYIQRKVIQAQFFRDPKNLETYMERCIFLPYINNEKYPNESYKKNIMALDKFVMIRFSEEMMIRPAYSTWFWTEDENHDFVSLQNRTLYKDDLLGLKYLNDQGRLEFLVCPGQHMQISDEYFENQVIKPYLMENEELRMIEQEKISFHK